MVPFFLLPRINVMSGKKYLNFFYGIIMESLLYLNH